MDKVYIDIKNLQTLLFERRQVLALLDDADLWNKIPLPQRFAIVNSCEFVLLMGEAFTERTRHMLEYEIEALVSTIH